MENLLRKVYLGSMSVLWPLEGREVADWAYLGIGDLDVPWPLGVYRGPPEVYRGPCMKNMRWNQTITYTYKVGTQLLYKANCISGS